MVKPKWYVRMVKHSLSEGKIQGLSPGQVSFFFLYVGEMFFLWENLNCLTTACLFPCEKQGDSNPELDFFP